MASETANLDRLSEHINALKNLLDDPHPGLFTWVEIFAKHMEAITSFWYGNESPDQGEVESLRKQLLQAQETIQQLMQQVAHGKMALREAISQAIPRTP